MRAQEAETPQSTETARASTPSPHLPESGGAGTITCCPHSTNENGLAGSQASSSSTHNHHQQQQQQSARVPIPHARTHTPQQSAQTASPPPVAYLDKVVVELSGGGSLQARPYGHCVTGHHIMLAQAGLIWKASRSRREKNFYETVVNATAGGGARGSTGADAAAAAGGEADSPHRRSALALLPFLPRYYGTRRVVRLRAASFADAPVVSPAGSPQASTYDAGDAPGSHGGPFADAGRKTSVLTLVSSPTSSSPEAESAAIRSLVRQFESDKREIAAERAAAEAAPQPQPQPHRREYSICNERFPSPGVLEAALNTTMLPHRHSAGDEAEAEAATPTTTAAAAATADSQSPPHAPRSPRARGPAAPGAAEDKAGAASSWVDMIVLEDVCHGFARPCVLDIKMGSRQYGLNASDKKRRSKEGKAAATTTMRYGVRLAGYKRWDPVAGRSEKRGKLELRSLDIRGVARTVRHFLTAPNTIVSCGGGGGRIDLRHRFLRLVRSLLRRFEEEQPVFRFYTTSLLFVYDYVNAAATARAVMIDFAYTYEQSELDGEADEDAGLTCDARYIAALRSLVHILQMTDDELDQPSEAGQDDEEERKEENQVGGEAASSKAETRESGGKDVA